MNYPQLSVQLYTVRDDLARDFGGTLKRVAAIGIKKVQTNLTLNGRDALQFANGTVADYANTHLTNNGTDTTVSLSDGTKIILQGSVVTNISLLFHS